ncbi:MAG: glycosyltransferase [Syntrophaceae bacterium]|nr:glycosyltransferase [Syntrophaceae bacterium]
MAPLVSVIMAVFNCENFVQYAIESVLSQTFQDFELIIVDDASTDGTVDILQRYMDNEKVVFIQNTTNKERSYSRNLAIHSAKGEYVAIMDADDICLPDRLEKQFAYLQTHPEIDVLGSNLEIIDDYNTLLGTKSDYPSEHAEIVWASVFKTCIANGTVLMKTSRVRSVGGYNIDLNGGEDTELWLRMMQSGSRFGNLADVLCRVRVNERQKRDVQKNSGISYKNRKLFLEMLLDCEISDGDYEAFRRIVNYKIKSDISSLEFFNYSNLVISTFTAMKSCGILLQNDTEVLLDKICRYILYIANKWVGAESKLLLPALKKVETIEWLKLFWECKKGYLKIRR